MDAGTLQWLSSHGFPDWEMVWVKLHPDYKTFWEKSERPTTMAHVLDLAVEPKQLRHFCCDTVQAMIQPGEDERIQQAVEVMRRYADGSASIDEVCKAAINMASIRDKVWGKASELVHAACLLTERYRVHTTGILKYYFDTQLPHGYKIANETTCNWIRSNFPTPPKLI